MNPGRFALLVGNHQYDNSNLSQLSASTGDATDFAAILKDGEFGGFNEVHTLIDLPVDEIRKGIARFFTGRSRKDLLLLYFSGHGVLDDRGRLYLAARDTEPDLLSATAIDAAFITDAMDRCRSTSQVLILDCCHSGAFARGAKGVVGGSVGTAAAFEGSGSGRVILTATDATQYAWEGDRIIGQAQNSLFTHFLLEGLRTGKADHNQDGWVTLDEWYDYVFEQVIAVTPKQTPARWSYKQQGEIRVARNPLPAPDAAILPRELTESLADARAWVREGAAAELVRLLHASPETARAAVAALQVLSKDDSRRVSSAATAGLESYLAQQAQGTGGVAPAIMPETATGNQNASIAPAAVRPASAGGAVISPGEIDRGETRDHLPMRGSGKIAALLRSAGWIHSPLFPVTATWCLGWLFSLGLALFGDDTRYLFLGWGLAGLGGDLVLRRFYRSSRLHHWFLLTLGWPLSLTPVAIVFLPVYSIFDNAGFDNGKGWVVAGFLLIWMALAGLISILRILPEDHLENKRRLILSAGLCWGGAFLLTLAITSPGLWNSALIRFVNGSPGEVLGELDWNYLTYFALSVNGILTAVLGFSAWSWLNRKTRIWIQAADQVS